MLFWIEDHPGLAAWLQAGGTLLALGIAVGVARHSHTLAERSLGQREWRDRARSIETLLAMARVTDHLIKTTVQILESKSEARKNMLSNWRQSVYDQARRGFAQVPLNQLGSGNLVMCVVALSSALDDVVGLIRREIEVGDGEVAKVRELELATAANVHFLELEFQRVHSERVHP